MPVRNLHQKPFDEGTRDKLELYREYLREWLPVFINGSSVDILPANKEGTLVLSVHRNLAKIIDDVQSVIPAIDHSPTQTCDNTA